MHKFILIFSAFLFVGCSKPFFDRDSVTYIKVGQQIVVDNNGTWAVFEDNVLYPASDNYIEGLLDGLYTSIDVRDITDNKSLFFHYGISESESIRIESDSGLFSLKLGNYTPGKLGQYVVIGGTVKELEGSFINYPIYRNCKDLDLKKEFNSFTDNLSTFRDTSGFTKVINFNSLLRSDVLDLVLDNKEIALTGYIEIDTDDGNKTTIEVKKRAGSYLLNFQAPFSYLISEKDFNNLF